MQSVISSLLENQKDGDIIKKCQVINSLSGIICYTAELCQSFCIQQWLMR